MKTLKIVLLAIVSLLTLNLNAQTTWQGDELINGTDWENAGNWSSGVPDLSDDVIIPFPTPNNPVIQSAPGSPAECANLTIDAGATLTISQDGALNIDGDVNNSGAIVIEDNGNFFQFDGYTYTGGSFTLSRTGTSDPLKFNMWSSPVAGQSVSAFSGIAYSFDPATSTSDPGDDANDEGWDFASGNMTVGVGYACAGCGTVTFSGTPNYGDLTVPVQYNDPNDPPGVPFNLIGNPYSSPLNINQFLTINSSDLETDAVYLWDNPALEPYDYEDYAVVNSSGFITLNTGNNSYSDPFNFIATGQGFFVEVALASDLILDFGNGMRGDGFEDNSKFYKQQSEMQRIWLGVSDRDSNVYNEILVAFTDSATTGFDKRYDAKKLVGNTRLSLYSVNNDRHYAIQGLPYLKAQEVEVPVGVSLDTSNTVTFSLKWEEELQDFDIYLEDKLTGTVIDLRNDDYTLQIPSGEHNGRFSILMTPKNATGISELAKKDLTIAQSNGVIHIGNPGNELQMLENITIFDMTGKKLKAWNTLTLGANGTISLPFEPGNSGHYVVNVVTGEKTIQQKVRIIN